MGGQPITSCPQLGAKVGTINVAREILILSRIIFYILILIITVCSGTLFRSNVVNDISNVETSKSCQVHCQEARELGCHYYIWEEVTKECGLYSGIYGIEYDYDHDKKCIGHVDNCMATMCERKGWDYVKTGSGYNIVQYGAVYDVEDVQQCLQICRLTPDCYFVR